MSFSANSILLGARVAHIRELKAENARLKADLARMTAACEAWVAHTSLAALAAYDTRDLPPQGKIFLFDGWNILLGARPRGTVQPRSANLAQARHELIMRLAAFVQAHPEDWGWLVFDGPVASAEMPSPRFRVSYTGGTGPQRADRLFLDYLHLLRLAGISRAVTLVSADVDLGQAAEKYHAQILTPDAFDNLR